MRVLPTLQKQHHPLASGAAQRRRLAELPLARTFEAALDGGRAPAARRRPGSTCSRSTSASCAIRPAATATSTPGRTAREMMPPDVVRRLPRRARPRATSPRSTSPAARPSCIRASAARRGRRRPRPARDRPLQPHHHAPAQLSRTCPRSSPSTESRSSPRCPYFAGTPDRRPARRGRLRRVDRRAAASSTRSATADAGSGLVLNLVTNPVGAFLPPAAGALERDWKRELRAAHGVVFNRLFTITNMPISRFLRAPRRDRAAARPTWSSWCRRFNPAAAAGRDVPHDALRRLGRHALRLRLQPDARPARRRAAAATHPRLRCCPALAGRTIALGPHCFGCTAGAGSSCGGAVA